MPWAVELSGEHAALARAEVRALAERAGGHVLDADLDRVVLGEGPPTPPAMAARVALARRIVDVHARVPVDPDAIVDAADRIPLDGQRFAVRCTRLDADQDAEIVGAIERRLGAALDGRGTVDLDDPELVVRVLLDREALVGHEAALVDRSAYEARHVEARPHFSPVSLHPRLARALVNLARVGPGDRVWDPFVGTGGVALEAALVGCRVEASDLDPEMVAGTRKMLDRFEVDAALSTGDVGEIARGMEAVDAVVTDPPYGRASTTDREGIDDLYERFLEAGASLLSPGARLVCVLPNPSGSRLAPGPLAVREHHEWYVHATLTRHVFVFERR